MQNDRIKNRGYHIIKPMIKSAIIGNIVQIIMIIIATALVWRGNIPESMISDLVICAVFAGGIAAGFSMCKKYRKGIALGAAGALAYFATILIIGIYRIQGDVFTEELIRHFIAAMVGGMFGGTLLIRKRSKRKFTHI